MIIFVVGMPRSGSTLLSRYLNLMDGVASLNDFYFYQWLAVNFNLYRKDRELFHKAALEYLSWFFQERALVNDPFEGQLDLDECDIARVMSQLTADVPSSLMRFDQIVSHYYLCIKAALNAEVLVDKTPQNFMHADTLLKIDDTVKFLYLLREPISTVCSFKYANFKGHDKRRYHPYIYAKYWLKTYKSYLTRKHEDNFYLLRYEDLAESPCAVKSVFYELGLDSGAVVFPDAGRLGNNSSNKSSSSRSLTELEIRILQHVLEKVPNELGYYFPQCRKVNFEDFLYLLKTTVTFMFFNLKRLLSDADSRNRILTFIKIKG
ncbi:sulfotransferase [Aestuariicella hydrocarbonica]|uniref:Sulfotransferase n=1 Tax=Pseudomaricurvus hydrocarbonicus TaxID=1470433 RepID=A0A9E5MQI6_9GAMM|nr:sulfotransferase [Aestuariicella hydrocarbonica]NHO68482.1 sulfotransferase [Aestuariicella hydrocarbonica]